MSTFDEPGQDVERPTTSDRADDIFENYEIERNGKPVEPVRVENPGACACRFCQEDFSSQQAESRHTCQTRRRVEWDVDYESPEFIEPNTHGVGAKLLYAEDGMSPYFGVVKAYDHLINLDDPPRFEYGGREWEFVFKHNIPDRWDEKGYTRHWPGKIAARPEDSFDAFNEYQIGIRARDYVGVMKATFQFRPALPNATHVETGDQIQSLPRDLPEGVRVQSSTSNIPVDDITGLLRAMAEQIGLNPAYFADGKVHEWSRIYNLEQYVRISRWASKRIAGDDGVLSRLSQFSAPREGSVGEFKWNNRDVTGKMTSFVVNRETWDMMVRDSVLAKRMKHYHPEHARKHESEADPLSSAKVEVQYSNKFNQKNSIPWSQRHEAIRELDEALINVLHWADIDIRPSEDVYVSDAYFDATGGSHRDIAVFEDPTPKAKEAEQKLTEHRIWDSDLTGKEKEVIRALATHDGESVHYERLAEAADVGTSTVYRLFEKLQDILRRENGVFSFQDSIIGEQVERIVDKVAHVGEWARDSIMQLVETERALESEDTPLAKWMNAHGITTFRTGSGVGFDLSNLKRSTEEIRRLLRAGYQAAVNSPFRTEDFEDAQFRWATEDGNVQKRNPFHYFGTSLRVLGQDVEYGRGASW